MRIAQAQPALQASGAKTTAAATIAAPGIVLGPGTSIHYVPSLVSWLTHSIDIIVDSMATNLNQIDSDLKALKAEVAALTTALGKDESDLTAQLAAGFAAINQRLDEVIGGPSDDQTQATIDDLTAKLKAQEEKLKAVVSPDK